MRDAGFAKNMLQDMQRAVLSNQEMSMIRDARDVAHSTSSALAIQHYETALEQFHSYRGDVLATLDAALAADPSFVSALLFKAFALFTLSEKKYLPDVAAALDAARAHASRS